MNLTTTLALAATALLAATPPVDAQTPSLNTFHKAYAYTRHCCWDAVYNYEWNQGEAPSYAATSWSASAQGAGSLAYGAISAQMSARADVTNYVYVNAIGEGRDYWVDTFTVTSGSLAAGTPVELRLRVDVAADVDTTGYGQGYALAVIGTGLDAGWLTGVDTRVVGEGAHTGSYSFMTWVGANVTLVGQLVARAWTEGTNGHGAATAKTNASANFIVESLTAGAGYVTASGHRYVVPTSPVPEPQTWALLLGGMAGLALWRRRQP